MSKDPMTHYRDLSPYEYFAEHEPLDPMPLNIGWLSSSIPYGKGATSKEFKDRLFEFCLDEFVVHLARGFHACEFCNLDWGQWYEEHDNQYGEKAHNASIGNGEIRVIGKSVIYASPTLIYHYVTEHQYKPPNEFIEAVLTGPLPSSEEHKNLLIKYA